MAESFVDKLAQLWPPRQWQGVTVVVAVSGGADSVALLRALHALQGDGAGRLLVAHYNHQLRGPQADDDESFVLDLCRQLDLACMTGRPDPPLANLAAPDGLEAAARRARYRFLAELARRRGARYVATAHTANDQAETILHRILRGTGLEGLTGIPRTRALGHGVSLVRPLCEFWRPEVLDYLTELQQGFREDPSNRDTTMTRNRIRHQLLPLLAEQYNPQIAPALIRLGRLSADAQAVLLELAESLAEQSCRSCTPHQLVFDQAPLRAAPAAVVRQMLVKMWGDNDWPRQAMSFDKWDQLTKSALQSEEVLAWTLPGHVVVRAERGLLTLERKPTSQAK